MGGIGEERCGYRALCAIDFELIGNIIKMEKKELT
jgi:hypothetical protein